MKSIMMDIDLARKILSSDGFFRQHELEVARVEVGEVELIVPMRESVERIGGIMSGGAIMSFSDAAFALCVMTLEDVVNEVSSSMSTNFYSPVKSGPVRFIARLRKEGRSLAYCSAEVRDAEGLLCAESFGTYKLYR